MIISFTPLIIALLIIAAAASFHYCFTPFFSSMRCHFHFIA